MTRRAGPVGLAVRAATTSPALTAFAILIVAITAFAGAAAPGELQRVQSESLRYALRATEPTARDFSADTRGAPIPASGRSTSDFGLAPELEAVWGYPLQQAADARSRMDPGLREVLAPGRVVVEFDPSDAVPVDPTVKRPRTRILLRYDAELDTRVRWVEGREPGVTDLDTGDVTEFGLTAEAAEAMDWSLDEQRDLPRPGGILQRVALVGIYEVIDPADDDWTHSPLAVHFSRVQVGEEPPLFTAVGFAAPADLQTPLRYTDNVSSSVWFPLDIDAMHADDTRALIASMRLFTTQSFSFEVNVESFFVDGLQFGSNAPITMTQALARLEATSALVGLIASGPLAVAIVVLALTARMLALRRRSSLQLAEARGASPRLRAGLLAVEGLIIGAIGGIGGGVAGAIVGGGRGPILWLVPVLVALTPAVVLPVLGLLVARRRVRADLGSGSVSAARWRAVAELGVVALAATASVLVLTGASSRSDGSPDPLITVLPLLLAAVGCVITLRLVPLGLALIERGVPARRGLIDLVGPARARRDPAVRVAPVLAVVVGVAIAVFSVSFAATVEAGTRVAARSAVGADLRVTAPYIAQEELDALASLDGVRATSPVYADEQRSAELPTADLGVMVYVIDVAELRAVQTEPDAAIPTPDALITDDATGPVPVIASAELAARVGDETLIVQGQDVDIVAIAPPETPLGSVRSWIAVDRSQADRLLATTFSPAVVLIDLTDDADATTVADEARSIVGAGGTASTPESVAETRLQDPALIGLQLALLAAIGVVALLLALAIGMTLVLGAPARGRLLALLGALGFRRTRELALIVWEVAPAVLIALPAGAAVGLTLPYIVVPALDLTGFIGGSVQPIVRLGGLMPLYVVLGFLAVTVLAVLVAALVARRVTAAGTLRSIDEEG
jgi:putative ABC transport system permease protein